MSYVCPDCHNDRHPPGAKFCIVCGTGFPLSGSPDLLEKKTADAGPGKDQAPHLGIVNLEGYGMNVDEKTGVVEVNLNCAVISTECTEPKFTPCKVTADTEAGKVIFALPKEKFAIALLFDEMLSIMAQGIVLFHQRHDGEKGDAHAE